MHFVWLFSMRQMARIHSNTPCPPASWHHPDQSSHCVSLRTPVRRTSIRLKAFYKNVKMHTGGGGFSFGGEQGVCPGKVQQSTEQSKLFLSELDRSKRSSARKALYRGGRLLVWFDKSKGRKNITLIGSSILKKRKPAAIFGNQWLCSRG